MKYVVKPEYQDEWFNGEFPEPVSMDEIERLSMEWEIPVEDLMEQVSEYEEEKEMKITVEEVARQLSENVSIEFGESNGHLTATYYLHMDEDGNLDRRGRIDFCADRDVSAYEGDEDASGIYDSETLEDDTFRAVCEDLAAQANTWIRKNM